MTKKEIKAHKRRGNNRYRMDADSRISQPYKVKIMKDYKNWRVFAKRFDDTTERIEEIRNFVPDNIIVGIDYADKDNPVIKLYNDGKDKPFAQGNVGDYVVNDNGRFDILPKGSTEITDLLLRQKEQ